MDALPQTPENITVRAMMADLLRDRRAERRSRFIKTLMYLTVFGVPAFICIAFFAWQSGLRPGPAGDVVGTTL